MIELERLKSENEANSSIRQNLSQIQVNQTKI